jgi:hypothetical protein
MIVWVKGRNLPPGAITYLYAYKGARIYTYIFEHLDYAFRPEDGLYASVLAREFWNCHPECHPHCTLFRILYIKLEL